jgi:hypothetical protein
MSGWKPFSPPHTRECLVCLPIGAENHVAVHIVWTLYGGFDVSTHLPSVGYGMADESGHPLEFPVCWSGLKCCRTCIYIRLQPSSWEW